MGEDYIQMVEQAYMIVDRFLHKIKEKTQVLTVLNFIITHSYVFISWTGKMTETFVLAHELGHASFLHWHNNIKIY